MSVAYRPEIDGLRAVAVLAVVLSHAGFGPAAGFMGVDVFFVISGYLITLILCRELAERRSIDFAAFYVRRIRRLVPALVLVVSTTLVLCMALFSSARDVEELAYSAAASLVFSANLFFESHTGGYFAPAAEHFPLLHLWSLGVEEQFYLVWPACLALLFRRGWRVRTTLGIAALLSFVLCEVLIATAPNAAFYQTPARFWELAVGGIVALRPAAGRTPGPALCALALALLAASLATPLAHFPGAGVAAPVVATAILLAGTESPASMGIAGAALRTRPIVYVGAISYSLYLWHWPLLAILRSTSPTPYSRLAGAAVCLVALALAAASSRYVEMPFRRARGGLPKRKLVAVVVTCSVATAVGLASFGRSWASLHQPTLAERIASDGPANRLDCHYRGDEPLGDFPRQACITAPGRPVRVAIWGDSHALAWQPFAAALAERDGASATSFTRDACAPALGYDNGKYYLDSSRCIEFNRRVVEWIAHRSEPIDTLILTALWPSGARQADFEARFTRTIARIAPHARHVLLIGPTPYLPMPVPQCVALHTLSTCTIPRARFEATSRPAIAFLKRLSAKFPRVQLVDVTDFFCNARTCPPMRDGYGLYWDANHVSATAASRFARLYLARAAAAAVAGSSAKAHAPAN